MTARGGAGPATAAAAAAFLLFAGNFIVSRQGVVAGLTPVDITALRFATAGLLAAPFLIRWGLGDLGGIGWRRGAILAAVAGVPYFAVMVSGLTFAPAANVVIINPGGTLLGGVVLSILWLKERPTPARLAAGAAALAGLGVIGSEDLAVAGDGDTWIGNLIFALTGMQWAVYMALLNHWRLDPVRAAVVVTVLSLAFLPLYFLFDEPRLAAAAPGDVLLQAGYQGIVHALIAVMLFSHAVRTLGVGTVALMVPIVPVAGLALAHLTLGEPLGPAHGLGAGLIALAAGISAASAWRRNPA